jgi:hypothetical protein
MHSDASKQVGRPAVSTAANAIGFALCFWFAALLASSVYLLTTAGLGTFESGVLSIATAISVCMIVFSAAPFETDVRLRFYTVAIAMLLPLYGYQLFSGSSLNGDSKVFDTRSKYEVVMELRDSGTKAYPNAHPYNFVKAGLEVEGETLVPLGAIPSVTTVFCSETGPFVVYESDKYGFRNPAGLWDRPIEIALVGDSFTEGACLSEAEHFTGRVRDRFPDTVNLGMSGNGPLLEMAAIREYLPAVKPKYVFWFYYEGNDLLRHREKEEGKMADIERDANQKTLMRYLEPDFDQGLIAKREALREAMLSYIESKLERKKKEMEEERDKDSDSGFGRGAAEFFTLSRVWKLSASFAEQAAEDEEEAEEEKRKKQGLTEARAFLPLYLDVVRVARDEVVGWGGKLVMVNLPDRKSMFGKKHPLKADVLAVWADLGLDVIDPTPTFASHPDPKSLRVLHYNEAGYALVADALLDYLDR